MPVDLRSDTVTRPTPAMREAMAQAEVGDDVYGEDPTVNELERRAAELCGMEAALLVPSGTMANQIAIRMWAGHGDEIYVHYDSHIVVNEGGGVAALWGVQPRTLGGALGRLDHDELLSVVPEDRTDPHHPVPRLVCVENTHMSSGGRVYPGDELQALGDLSRELGMRLHVDGARLPNAVVASGRTFAEVCAPADSVQFCLSKGLGAPVGSMVCGPAEAIDRGRRYRKLLGGGMRQAGILAAAGLHALDNHVERLADDHRRARALTEALVGCQRLAFDPDQVETNIIMAAVREADDSPAYVVADLERAGVLADNLHDRRRVRFVTHLGIGDDELDQAIAGVRSALGLMVG